MTLRAIRDSGDAFPPLKSAAAAIVTVSDICDVRFHFELFSKLLMNPQNVKSNNKDCKRLIGRATEIVDDIWRQTKWYGPELPVEVQESIDEMERSVIIFQSHNHV